MKFFLKVFLPLAICLMITSFLFVIYAFRILPAQIRDFQRQTIEDFRDVLAQEPMLSLPRAQTIADSLSVQVRFIPAAEPGNGRPPEHPAPGHVFFPATREFPYITEVSTFPGSRGPARHILTFILILVVIEGLVLYLALRPLQKRVTRLSWAANEFGSGNLGSRIPERKKGDQIDSLGRTFNKMAGQIESLVNSHHDLLGSVAHELRTPLARMELALELIRDNPEAGEEKLDRMEKDLKSLDNLVSELLAFNKLGRLDTVSSEEVDLALLCSEVTQTEIWGRPDITITLDGSASCMADHTLLARAIGNLVRNAVRHAESLVNVTVSSCDGECSIEVTDDGKGFHPSVLEKAGVPFVKGPGSKGAGLGLAIASRIARLHGGTMQTTNAADGGARARLLLPDRS
jgi:signal transduction histidine kinase